MKNEGGGVKGHLDFFQKFIRFGSRIFPLGTNSKRDWNQSRYSKNNFHREFCQSTPLSWSQSSSSRTIRRSEDRCTRDICPRISRCVNQPNCPAQPYLHENPRSPGINHPTPATLIYTFTKALVRTATLCWSPLHREFLYLLSVNTGVFTMNEYLRYLQSTRALRLI